MHVRISFTALKLLRPVHTIKHLSTTLLDTKMFDRLDVVYNSCEHVVNIVQHTLCIADNKTRKKIDARWEIKPITDLIKLSHYNVTRLHIDYMRVLKIEHLFTTLLQRN